MGDTTWFEGTAKATGAGVPLVKSSRISSPGPARWTSPRTQCPGSCGCTGSSSPHSHLLAQPNEWGLIWHFAVQWYLFPPTMTPQSRHVKWSHHTVFIDGNDGQNPGQREGWVQYTPGITGFRHHFSLPALTPISKKMRNQSNTNK